MRTVLAGLLLMGLLSGASSCEDMDKRAKAEGAFERTLSVSDPVKLVVETGSGDIAVKRGVDDQVIVKGRFVVRAPEELARELAERIEADPPIEVRGRVIEIGDLRKYREALGLFDKGNTSIAMSFEIEVPFTTEAVLDSGSGDQIVQGIRGPVRADTGSGDVTVEGVERAVFVDTGSGDIAVKGASRVEADAGSGDVHIEDISGDVNVDVGSGNVSLENVGGSVSVDIGSGNVEVASAIAEGARWEIDTSSGDVRLRLPKEAQFKLYVGTSSGRIDVEFPLDDLKRIAKGELRGVVGESPSAEIHIETGNGNAIIQSDGDRP